MLVVPPDEYKENEVFFVFARWQHHSCGKVELCKLLLVVRVLIRCDCYSEWWHSNLQASAFVASVCGFWQCGSNTVICRLLVICDFYAPQLCRQALLRRVLAMGILSVCPSVTTRWYTKPRWDRDSGSSPYDNLEFLVSNKVIWCRWVRRFPSNEGIKEGYPLKNRYFTTIGSSSVKTVADRHRLAACHSKHCRRAFKCYQHRWPWTTLKPPNRRF